MEFPVKFKVRFKKKLKKKSKHFTVLYLACIQHASLKKKKKTLKTTNGESQPNIK